MTQQASRQIGNKQSFMVGKSSSETESNDSRQSLLNRSRKILGETVELGEAPRKILNDVADQSSDNDFLSKRRAQVRQAQRTHRQRTQTYIRTLEKEVLRLRNCESAALLRISQLEKQVDTLLNALSDSRVTVPPQYFKPWNDPITHTATISLNPNNDSEPLVNMRWQPETNFEDCSNRCKTVEVGEMDAAAYQSFVKPIESEDEVQLPASLDALKVKLPYISIFQDPRIGIDFILALERSCLAHIRDSPLDHKDNDYYINEHPDGISGHLFTASLSLWQPTSPSRESRARYPVSQQELDRLLQTSLNIGVGGNEITPVQLWHRLQNIFSKDSVISDEPSLEVLEVLVTKLGGHVKCLHYGAVMDNFDVDAVLGEVFPSLKA